MLHILSIFHIKMAVIDSPILMFFLKKMHNDMTAVTIQSNKIVLNEVKDNYRIFGL